MSGPDTTTLLRFAPLEVARTGDLTPLLAARFTRPAMEALERGATVLANPAMEAMLRASVSGGATIWSHPIPAWAMAKVLSEWATVADTPPSFGPDLTLGPYVHLGPRVVVGARVTVGASSVVGGPGFGWVVGPDGERTRVPQLGGVVIEDDVSIGPLVTIDAGTLGPTILRRGVKIDAQVHIGHNCEVGPGTVIAAQTGLAGSVKVGRRVLLGGQVGVADHVTIGDDARVAAKSGVIGDVAAGTTVAGYPAVGRTRWLRGLAELYRLIDRGQDRAP